MKIELALLNPVSGMLTLRIESTYRYRWLRPSKAIKAP